MKQAIGIIAIITAPSGVWSAITSPSNRKPASQKGAGLLPSAARGVEKLAFTLPSQRREKERSD